MSASSTVPAHKYRRLKLITFVLLGVSVFLAVALIAQLQGQQQFGAEATGGADETTNVAPSYIRADPADPMAIGDPDAPVVLSEWVDMRCPFCAVYTRDTMPQLVAEYVDAGLVRIEFNDVSFFGDDSTTAAVAVRAAGNQGKYVEYLHALFAAAPESGHPDMPRAKLLGFAEDVGVPDLEQFERDLDDPALLMAVQESTTSAQQLGVNSVPFFVADGVAIAGAQPMENFRQFLDDALAKAQQ